MGGLALARWNHVRATRDVDLLIALADAAALLRANRSLLELTYLTQWVAKLGFETPFSQIWSEAFPGDSAPI